ncbi:MAG: aldolase/citrate lyase family protein [Steroidobacteraceae bacterium]
MAELPRLNGMIGAWERGRPAFLTFAQAERQTAIEVSQAPLDAVIFEMEHNAWDPNALQDSMQYLLNRKQILDKGTVAPAVTPIVRIPANGAEKSQWLAKQALDRGVYGVIFPHISTADQAYSAVAACRYPRQKGAEFYEPKGARGDGPHTCSRYWGVSQQEYYARADVWPLNPKGEILVVIMIESEEAVANIGEILKVPGVGAVLIGEGDLSQQLGFPRQYEHPVVRDHMSKIVAACKKHNVPVGHPHVTSKNVDGVVAEGYRWLVSAATRSYGAFERARALTGG